MSFHDDSDDSLGMGCNTQPKSLVCLSPSFLFLPGMFRNSDGIDFTAMLKLDNNWYTGVTDTMAKTKMSGSTIDRKEFKTPDSCLISITQ